jgi:flagellar basal body rod protein FlgB
MSSVISASTTSSTALTLSGDTSGQLEIKTGSTPSTAVTINSSQNVGIGTSSPGCKLDVYNSAAAAANNEILRLRYVSSTTAGHSGDLNFTNQSGTALGRISNVIQDGNNVALTFSTYSSSLAERMRINSVGQISVSGSTTSFDTTGDVNGLQFYYETDQGIGTIGTYSNGGSTDLTFHTNDSSASVERMRITYNGSFLIGSTTSNLETGVGFKFVKSGTTPYTGIVVDGNVTNYHIYNVNAVNNGYRFYVNANGGISNYSGNNVNLSDERTKTNIELSDSYLNKICSIPVKKFNYKDESTGEQKTLGVIAQDVEAVAPEFVDKDGWKGKAPEGEEPLKSIYTTDLMFALMKSIQELNAKVEAQAAEIAALKNPQQPVTE